MMKQVTNTKEIRSSLVSSSKPLVLVPTMGALHDGHAALIKHARKLAGPSGTVVVSIFVNPLQFDRQEDLESYPSTLENDLDICRNLNVDLAFTPSALELYSKNHSINIIEKSLSNLLCGATRPGHFDGVCTVVAKLFNIFQPSHAIFGKKDFQQFSIIKRMVRDLDYPIEIIGVETIRETDGLALSSRNTRLSDTDRQHAPIIYKALVAAKSAFISGERSSTAIKMIAKNIINSTPSTPKIDYLDCLDSENLQPIEHLDTKSILATAVFFGNVRLIDNIELTP